MGAARPSAVYLFLQVSVDRTCCPDSRQDRRRSPLHPNRSLCRLSKRTVAASSARRWSRLAAAPAFRRPERQFCYRQTAGRKACIPVARLSKCSSQRAPAWPNRSHIRQKPTLRSWADQTKGLLPRENIAPSVQLLLAATRNSAATRSFQFRRHTLLEAWRRYSL